MDSVYYSYLKFEFYTTLTIGGVEMGFVAAGFAIVSYVTYFRAMVWGNTRPNSVTWLIWFVVNSITASAYYAVGARSTLLLPCAVTVGCFVTFLASLKYGYGLKNWNIIDNLCLGGAGVALILWAIFSPVVGLLGGICVNFLAIPPTLLKIRKDPKSEDVLTWVIKIIGYSINVVAVDHWIFQIWIYPVYGGIASVVVLFALFLAHFFGGKVMKAVRYVNSLSTEEQVALLKRLAQIVDERDQLEEVWRKRFVSDS